MKDKIKIWFEFLDEFRKRGHGEGLISKLWKVAEMFLEGERLSAIYAGHTLSEVQEVTNWLEANGYLPEKYNTPLNVS